MRFDLSGIFWDDYVPPKVKKEKVVRTPPEPVWLRDDYLPDLEQARAYRFDLLEDWEIMNAAANKDRLVWDTEFYPNYALLGFKHIRTGKIIKFESNPWGSVEQLDKLGWVIRNFTLVGFNDTLFDIPMVTGVLAGWDTKRCMAAVIDLIRGGESFGGMRPAEFYRAHKIKPVFVDSIDLIELTPLAPGLKICAGRMHSPRMADLPFPPEKVLSPEQIDILKWYWVNDLDNTQLLYEKHKTALELRETLTAEYRTDVRSKSDPQIAESVIRAEIKRITKQKYFDKAKIEPGRCFKYRDPGYLQFKTPKMQSLLSFILSQKFVVDDWGSPKMPQGLEELDIEIGTTVYRMGIGGLHSKEKKQVHIAGDQYELTDNDVTSYYPALILQQGMYPPNIGPIFLQVFKRIVDRRIAAKRAGDKATAETLKIVVNGTFGKTGERGGHSVVYYPDMMIQVTLSGQLSLLLLIEWLELEGIQIVSANTDGIVIKCPRYLVERKQQIINEWQTLTGLELESVEYKAIYSRDVNNYIAIYKEPQKGELAKAIGAYRKTLDVYPLKWNPTCDICSEAVIKFLAQGTPVEATIRECQDVRKFIEVRRVTGGACKDGVYFGKVIRWYYAEGVEDEIINAKNGHFVPRSKGAKVCMTLPTSLPSDIDYEYYNRRAYDILDDLSALDKNEAKAA